MKLNISTFFSVRSRGFTLIELLVVIGILGILAAALIATIDPFEQLRKANDTSARTTAVEFLDANTRYYGSKGAYPWSTTGEGGDSACNTAGYPSNGTLLSAMPNCITALVNQGELKSTFSSATNVLKTVYAVQADINSPLKVCYKPVSKSAQKDANTIYSQNGSAATGCIAQGGSTACFACVQ
jgi:prepilin-type N-terminal cleavage/methylation domain-containing protein